MLVESFVCHNCGAPKSVLSESPVVYCDHCEGVVAYLEPSATPKQRLHDDVKHPERTWRLLAASAAMVELLASDPEAAARYAPVNAASMALSHSARDPADVARALLAAWRTYYQWVRSRLSEHAAVIDPEVCARSMLRMSLRGVQALLGEGVVARVRHDVLGDTVTHVCASCGAALENDAVSACGHCGAVARVEADDPWVAGVLAQWAPNQERLVREGKLDTLEAPLAAIQLTLFSVIVGTGKVTPEGLHRMLVRLIPWVLKSKVVEAIVVLQGSATPAARDTLLGARPLIDSSWRADRSRRPVAKQP
ncbi:MAG TPA: hypothetical protein VF316_16545 [Polyangiaceae bacterium]